MKSYQIIKMLKELLTENTIVVSSNGNISREVYHLLPRPQLYLRGSMGLPIAVGLGLALAQPEKEVLVITGDGNFLMGLSSMVTLTMYRPKNMKVLVLDNESYETTGGQKTGSFCLNYLTFFESLGVKERNSIDTTKETYLERFLTEFLNNKELSLLHLKIETGKIKLENIPCSPEKIKEKVQIKMEE